MPHDDDGQPIGPSIGDWIPPVAAPTRTMHGRWVTVRPWQDADAAPLFDAFSRSPTSLWTYLPWGPFERDAELGEVVARFGGRPDVHVVTIVVDDVPEGMAAYLRIAPRDGVLEIGSITLSDRLQRTAAATEAMSLMIGAAMDDGF